MSTASKQGKLSDGMPQISEARRARIEALATYVAPLPWFNVDVLHKLYLNFFADQPPARAAEEDGLTDYDLRAITCTDFIQSPLVSRIDYNVFMLAPQLRDELRNQVKGDQATMKRIGEFMLAYADYCRSHFLSTRYVEVYKVEGNLIVNPRAEASRIARHVAAQLNDKRDLETMEPTVGYYLNLLNQEGQDTGNEELTTFLKGLDNYLKEDRDEAMEEWEKLRPKDDAPTAKSISIKLPRKVRQAIIQEIKGTDASEVKKVRAKVFIDQGTGEIYASSWKSYQTETSTYVFVDEREAADFIINMTGGRLKVQPQGGGMPVYETDSARGLGLDNVLQALGRWTQMFHLANSRATISKDEIQVQIEVIEGVDDDKLDDAVGEKFENPEVVRLQYKTINGEEKDPAMRASIRVNGSEPRYVAILGLSADGNVNLVLPCKLFESGELHSMSESEGYGTKNKTLPMFVDDKYQLHGITEVTDYLKIIVSRSEFSVEDWEQDIESLGNVDNKARSAGLITVDGIDANTMFRNQQDWLAYNIRFVTTRPLPTESKQAQNQELETEPWQITSNTPSPVRSVAFSPDGQLALTGYADGSLHLFDVASGYCVLSVSEHTGAINDVAFAPDGRTFLSGSADQTAKIWSLEGVCLYTLTGHEDAVLAVAFSPRGDVIATGSKDRTHRLWDTRGNTVQTFPEHETTVSSIAFSPDGRSVVTGHAYTTLVKGLIRRGETMEAIQELLKLVKDQNEESLFNEFTLLYSRYQLLEKNRKDGLINQKDYSTKLATLNLLILELHQKTEEGNTESNQPDSTVNFISLWSVEGELIRSFGDLNEDVKRVVFHPDGLSVLTCSNTAAGYKVGKSNAKLWSTEGELLQTFNPDNGGVSDVSFSPDGKSVLGGGHYGLITRWSVTGEKLSETRSGTGRINSVAFGPDNGVYLAGREDEVAELLSTTGEELKTFLSSKNLARVGPFGKLNRQPFISVLPEGARLVGLEVRAGLLIDQLKLSYRLGKEEQEIVIGGRGGEAQPTFWINSPVTKITGRAGDQLDQVQFHFEDGTSTPVYGGGGGKPFSVSFTEYEFAGFFGRADTIICQLGFFGKAAAQRSY